MWDTPQLRNSFGCKQEAKSFIDNLRASQALKGYCCVVTGDWVFLWIREIGEGNDGEGQGYFPNAGASSGQVQGQSSPGCLLSTAPVHPQDHRLVFFPHSGGGRSGHVGGGVDQEASRE